MVFPKSGHRRATRVLTEGMLRRRREAVDMKPASIDNNLQSSRGTEEQIIAVLREQAAGRRQRTCAAATASVNLDLRVVRLLWSSGLYPNLQENAGNSQAGVLAASIYGEKFVVAVVKTLATYPGHAPRRFARLFEHHAQVRNPSCRAVVTWHGTSPASRAVTHPLTQVRDLGRLPRRRRVWCCRPCHDALGARAHF